MYFNKIIKIIATGLIVLSPILLYTQTRWEIKEILPKDSVLLFAISTFIEEVEKDSLLGHQYGVFDLKKQYNHETTDSAALRSVFFIGVRKATLYLEDSERLYPHFYFYLDGRLVQIKEDIDYLDLKLRKGSKRRYIKIFDKELSPKVKSGGSFRAEDGSKIKLPRKWREDVYQVDGDRYIHLYNNGKFLILNKIVIGNYKKGLEQKIAFELGLSGSFY